jgi:PiT family inorganic phosphate transporter
VRLDAFSALVVVLAEAITMHAYTFVGVPVSASQAVVGAVLGVGIVKGINTIRRGTLINILLGWFLTPAIACSLTLVINFVVHLHYVVPK